MAKYHINIETGKISECKATMRVCPIGSESEHFDSFNEAKKNSEEKYRELYGGVPTLSRKNDRDKELDLSKYLEKMSKEDIELLKKQAQYESVRNFVKKKDKSNGVYLEDYNQKSEVYERFLPGTKFRTEFGHDAYEILDTYNFPNDPFISSSVKEEYDDVQISIKNLRTGEERTFIGLQSFEQEFGKNIKTVYRPEILNPERNYFTSKYARGSIAILEKTEKISISKGRFGGKKTVITPSKELNIKVLKNNGSFITFKDTDTGEIREEYIEKFKQNYTTVKNIYCAPYRTQKEFNQHIKNIFTKGDKFVLYSEGEESIEATVKELRVGTVTFTKNDGSNITIENSELDGYGKYTYVNMSDNLVNNTNNSQNQSNGLDQAEKYHRNDVSNIIANPYTGHLDTDLTYLARSCEKINASDFSISKFKEDDVLTIVNSSGMVTEPYVRVNEVTDKEILYSGFSTTGENIISDEYVKINNLTIYREDRMV